MKNPTQYLWKGLCALLLVACCVLGQQWKATDNYAQRTETKLAQTEKTADSLRIVLSTKATTAQSVTVEMNTGKQRGKRNCPCK